MHSKASAEDDEQVFITAGTPDEISTSSRAMTKDIDTANFGQSIQQLISNKVVTDEFYIHKDVIKLLAEFLDVRDYETNLVSSWVLKTIAEQLIGASNKISTRDYGTFVLWLHEEINLIFDDPDMQREQFFELMSNVFYRTLSEILNGKGVFLPSRFLYQKTRIDTELTESISSRTDNDKNSVSNSDTEQLEDVALFQQKSLELIELDEELLSIIIESTYQVFGKESNYMLIRAAYKNQKNIDYYAIPYHFRNPRIIKKFEILTQKSSASILKSKKAKEKRKSSKKNITEEITEITKSTPIFDINQFRFILPLSEALEAENIIDMHKNSVIETNSNISDV